MKKWKDYINECFDDVFSSRIYMTVLEKHWMQVNKIAWLPTSSTRLSSSFEVAVGYVLWFQETIYIPTIVILVVWLIFIFIDKLWLTKKTLHSNKHNTKMQCTKQFTLLIPRIRPNVEQLKRFCHSEADIRSLMEHASICIWSIYHVQYYIETEADVDFASVHGTVLINSVQDPRRYLNGIFGSSYRCILCLHYSVFRGVETLVSLQAGCLGLQLSYPLVSEKS